MISLAVLPYVPKTKDRCCCEDQGPPLDIPIEYYILSFILMIVVVIFVYRYLRKEGGLRGFRRNPYFYLSSYIYTGS